MRTSTVVVVLATALATSAAAQTGVSDDRVSLPEGPGSLEGIGDNASIDPNQGAMAYAIAIDLPAGFPGVTPSLSLNYSSNAPSGVMGIGWDMAVPYIERMTNLRLPDYDADDDWVVGGGEQIVRVDDGEPAIYRARFEGGFSRYRWYERGDGTAGYWRIDSPDGITSDFGADAAGERVPTARVAGRGGAVFRYQLVEIRDQFDHRAEYHYVTLGGLPYLDAIECTFTGSADGNTPSSRVTFEYEEREDRLSDARSGANEIETRRLTAINVYATDTRIWRYALSYEPYADAGGLSRLAGVQRFGIDNVPHPVAFAFEYSKSLGATCEADCESPYLVEMGALGINLASGDATLVDLDGDALPDVVDTSRPGAHRVFFDRFNGRNDHVFAEPVSTDNGTQASHQLRSAYVQMLDANGDGRADLVNVSTGEVLYNTGDGDWSDAEAMGDANALPDFGEDFAVGDEELAHIRFFDYDNDRKIDVLRSSDVVTQIYRNMGDAGFELVDEVDNIGRGFDDARLELADMNGDGLLDPVIINLGSVSYRINLGFGRWMAWREILDLPFKSFPTRSLRVAQHRSAGRSRR